MGERLTGRDFWNKLQEQFDVQTHRSTFSTFSQAYDLFGQATLTLDAKAFGAVGLVCRSTVEAACYLFLTRKKEGVILTIDPPRTLDGRVRKVTFTELRKGIKKVKVLSDEQLRKLDRIANDGDLIAHLAEITDRTVLHSLDQNPDRAPPTQIWLSEEQAVQDLEDTMEILVTLVRAASGAIRIRRYASN